MISYRKIYPIIAFLSLAIAFKAYANPQGEQVVSGSATFDRSQPDTFTVNTTSTRTIINYDSFSIDANETTRINQPSADSVTLNRVIGVDPSLIYGTFSSNGRLFLVNPNGILFGATSRVDAPALVASTLDITNEDFLKGNYKFFKSGKGAFIINRGRLAAQPGGYIALLSQAVDNQGLIIADLGTVMLAAGEKMTLALDSLGQISVVVDDAVKSTVLGPDGQRIESALKNSGTIQADGGKVILTAKVLNAVFDYAINNTGIIHATNIVNHNGVIELLAEGAPVVNSGSLKANNIAINAERADFSNYGSIIANLAQGIPDTGNLTIKAGGDILLAGTIEGDNIIITPESGRIINDLALDLVSVSLILQGGGNLTSGTLDVQSGSINRDRYVGPSIARTNDETNILDTCGIGTSNLANGPPELTSSAQLPTNAVDPITSEISVPASELVPVIPAEPINYGSDDSTLIISPIDTTSLQPIEDPSILPTPTDDLDIVRPPEGIIEPPPVNPDDLVTYTLPLPPTSPPVTPPGPANYGPTASSAASPAEQPASSPASSYGPANSEPAAPSVASSSEPANYKPVDYASNYSPARPSARSYGPANSEPAPSSAASSPESTNYGPAAPSEPSAPSATSSSEPANYKPVDYASNYSPARPSARSYGPANYGPTASSAASPAEQPAFSPASSYGPANSEPAAPSVASSSEPANYKPVDYASNYSPARPSARSYGPANSEPAPSSAASSPESTNYGPAAPSEPSAPSAASSSEPAPSSPAFSYGPANYDELAPSSAASSPESTAPPESTNYDEPAAPSAASPPIDAVNEPPVEASSSPPDSEEGGAVIPPDDTSLPSAPAASDDSVPPDSLDAGATFTVTVTVSVQSYELPSGGYIVFGDVIFDYSTPGILRIISLSDRSIVDWPTFNISENAVVNINQPNARSVFLNRVIGADPSRIAGTLTSNGRVYLVNPNGILFTATSRVDLPALVASTLNIHNDDFLNGRYNFFKDGEAVCIVNQGNIVVCDGGYIALLSQAVDNQGLIIADLGTVMLAAGEKMTLALDSLGQISVVVDDAVKSTVLGPDGQRIESALKNSGTIQADGGKVILTAKVLKGIFDYAINNSGIIEAAEVGNDSGIIALVAEGAPVANSGTLAARRVSVSSDFDFVNTGSIIANGSSANPDGGVVLIQAAAILQQGYISANADEGGTAGEIDLVSETSTVLDEGSTTEARALGLAGEGGRINLDSKGGKTQINKGALIDISAGSVSGNAGSLYVGAFDQLGFFGILNGRAPPGFNTATIVFEYHSALVPTISITTDQTDYSPSDKPIITGSGFLPNQQITLNIYAPDGSKTTVSVTADGAGNFTYYYTPESLMSGGYVVIGSDGTRSAVAKFSDATITITTNTNWSDLTVTPGDIIKVQNGAILYIDVSNALCAKIQLGGTSPGSGRGTLRFTGSDSKLTVTGDVILGDGVREGSIDMSNGGTLSVGGKIDVKNLGLWAPGSGTIEYSRLGNQTISAALGNYNNLTTSGSGTKTLGGNITVNGDLTIGTDTTLNVSGSDYKITIKGNWINNGSFSQRNGKVFFIGSAVQSISGSSSTTFYNFTLDNSNGVTLYTPTTVSHTLTFINGKFNITVTADAKSKTYGDADPALTYQLTSGLLLTGDSFSGALSRISGNDAGDYAITQDTLTAGSYYNLTFVSANLTINKADASFAIVGYTGTYDNNPHGASGTATGVNGEDLSPALNFGDSFTDVPGGTSNWTFAGGTNYNDASGSVAIEITPRDLNPSATGQNKVYDGTTTATVTFSDDRLAGDALTYTYAANFDTAEVGIDKPVTVIGISISGDDAGNYRLLNDTADTTARIMNPGEAHWIYNAATSNWAAAGNWDIGFVPTADYAIVIEAASPAGHNPVLDMDRTVNSLTINPTAALDVNDHVLTITLDLFNSGTITTNTGAIQIIAGSISKSGTITNADNPISLTTTTGNIEVDTINAGSGDVTLDSAGAISDADANSSITADDLILIANVGIGTLAKPINTTVNTLSARTTTSGDIYINETNDLGLKDISALGTVKIIAGGEITDANDASVNNNITAEYALLYAQAGIGQGNAIETMASHITADTTAGDIRIDNTNASPVTADTTAPAGNVYFNQYGGGTLRVSNAQAGGGNAVFNVYGSANLIIETISALHTAELVAHNGSIINGLDATGPPNVIAENLILSATAGIGYDPVNGNKALQTQVSHLQANTIAGNLNIVNSGNVYAAPNSLSAGGNINLSLSPVDALGNLSIQTILEAIASYGGACTISLSAGTYNGSVTISKANLTLTSASAAIADNPILQGAGAGTGITILADNVTISHLTIQGYEIAIDVGAGVNTLAVTNSYFNSNSLYHLRVPAAFSGSTLYDIYKNSNNSADDAGVIVNDANEVVESPAAAGYKVIWAHVQDAIANTIAGANLDLFHQGDLDLSGTPINTGGGDVHITNKGLVTLGSVNTGSGSIVISINGDPDLEINGTVDTGGGNIDLDVAGYILQTTTGRIYTRGGYFNAIAGTYYTMLNGSIIDTRLGVANGSISLTADEMNLSGTLNAGSNTVSLRQKTNGRPIDLGTNGIDSTLCLADSELDKITAGLLRIGDAFSGAIYLSANINPAHTSNLSLITGAGISQAPDTALTVSNLALQAAGAIDLPSANNDVNNIAAIISGAANFSFRDKDSINISNGIDGVSGINVATGDVSIISGKDVTDTGAVICRNLTVKTLHDASGDIILDNPANDADTIDLQTFKANGTEIASGTITYVDTDAVTIRNIVTNSNAAITAGGAVDEDPGAAIIAFTLTVRTKNDAGADINLGNSANNVTYLDLRARNAANTANAPGLITYTDSDGLRISNISTAGDVNLTAAGALYQSGPITCLTLTLTNTAGITDLSTASNAISHLGAINAAGQSFLLKNSRALDQTGVISADTFALTNTAGDTNLGLNNVVSHLGAINAAGRHFTFRNTLAIDQTGPITADVLTIDTSAGAGGGINLTNANNDADTIELTSKSGSNIDYTDKDGVDIALANAGTGNVTITAGNNVTDSGPIIADTLKITILRNSGADITLDDAGTDVNNLDLRVRNAADNANASGDIIFVDIDGLNINNISTLGNLNLTAAGLITQSGPVTCSTLRLTNTAAATDLSTQDNAISHLGVINATGQSFTLKNTRSLDQTGAITADTFSIENTGDTTLNNSANSINKLGAIQQSAGAFSLINTQPLTIIGDISAAGQSVSINNGANAITFTGVNVLGDALTLTASDIDGIGSLSSLAVNTLTLRPDNTAATIGLGVTDDASFTLTLADIAKIKGGVNAFGALIIGNNGQSGALTLGADVHLEGLQVTIHSGLINDAVNKIICGSLSLNLKSGSSANTVRTDVMGLSVNTTAGSDATGRSITVTEENDLDLGTINVGSGSFTLYAGGPVSSSGKITARHFGAVLTSGSLILTRVPNDIDYLETITAPLGFALDNGNHSLTLNQPVTTVESDLVFGYIYISTGTGTLTSNIGAPINAGRGAIVITANEINFKDTVTGGSLLLQPFTAGRGIIIGGNSNVSGRLNLTLNELAKLVNGFDLITIGRSDSSGAIDIRSVTFYDPVIIRSPAAGGSISVNGTLVGADNASITLIGSGATTFLNGSIFTAGMPIFINDGVILGTPALVTLSTANGVPGGADITISGAINDDGASSQLVLNAGTSGDINLNGEIGTTQPIAALQITSANDVNFNAAAIIIGSLTQLAGTGTTTINDLITCGDVDITTGAIAFENDGSITADSVTLTADAGSITSGSAEYDITAANVVLNALNSIGVLNNRLSVCVSTLEAESTGAGSIYLNLSELVADAGLELVRVITNDGNIDIVSSASTTASNLEAEGDVTIVVNSPVAHNLYVGYISGNNVHLTTNSGSIIGLNLNDTDPVDIIANHLYLNTFDSIYGNFTPEGGLYYRGEGFLTTNASYVEAIANGSIKIGDTGDNETGHTELVSIVTAGSAYILTLGDVYVDYISAQDTYIETSEGGSIIGNSLAFPHINTRNLYLAGDGSVYGNYTPVLTHFGGTNFLTTNASYLEAAMGGSVSIYDTGANGDVTLGYIDPAIDTQVYFILADNDILVSYVYSSSTVILEALEGSIIGQNTLDVNIRVTTLWLWSAGSVSGSGGASFNKLVTDIDGLYAYAGGSISLYDIGSLRLVDVQGGLAEPEDVNIEAANDIMVGSVSDPLTVMLTSNFGSIYGNGAGSVDAPNISAPILYLSAGIDIGVANPLYTDISHLYAYAEGNIGAIAVEDFNPGIINSGDLYIQEAEAANIAIKAVSNLIEDGNITVGEVGADNDEGIVGLEADGSINGNGAGSLDASNIIAHTLYLNAGLDIGTTNTLFTNIYNLYAFAQDNIGTVSTVEFAPGIYNAGNEELYLIEVEADNIAIEDAGSITVGEVEAEGTVCLISDSGSIDGDGEGDTEEPNVSAATLYLSAGQNIGKLNKLYTNITNLYAYAEGDIGTAATVLEEINPGIYNNNPALNLIDVQATNIAIQDTGTITVGEVEAEGIASLIADGSINGDGEGDTEKPNLSAATLFLSAGQNIGKLNKLYTDITNLYAYAEGDIGTAATVLEEIYPGIYNLNEIDLNLIDVQAANIAIQDTGTITVGEVEAEGIVSLIAGGSINGNGEGDTEEPNLTAATLYLSAGQDIGALHTLYTDITNLYAYAAGAINLYDIGSLNLIDVQGGLSRGEDVNIRANNDINIGYVSDPVRVILTSDNGSINGLETEAGANVETPELQLNARNGSIGNARTLRTNIDNLYAYAGGAITIYDIGSLTLQDVQGGLEEDDDVNIRANNDLYVNYVSDPLNVTLTSDNGSIIGLNRGTSEDGTPRPNIETANLYLYANNFDNGRIYGEYPGEGYGYLFTKLTDLTAYAGVLAKIRDVGTVLGEVGQPVTIHNVIIGGADLSVDLVTKYDMLLAGLISDPTDVKLTSFNGAIIDANDSEDRANLNIRTNELTLSATNGIGLNNALETEVSNLSALNTSSGDININNNGDLNAASVINEANPGNINLTTSGNLTVGTIAALDDTVSLTATNGSINGDGISSPNVTANTLRLNAGANIGRDSEGTNNILCTDITNLYATAAGDIYIHNLSDLYVNKITADSGGVRGNVYLRVDGAIVDNNEIGADITAGSLILDALTGIGSTSNPLETAVSNLAARITSTESGSIVIDNTGDLTIFDATGLNSDYPNGIVNSAPLHTDNVRLTVHSSVTINAPILTSGGDLFISGTAIYINSGLVDTSGGNQEYSGNVFVGVQDATLTGGAIAFDHLLDGPNGLTINGNTTFSGAVGSLSNLAHLTVNGTSSINADITTAGAQEYNGAVELYHHVSLTAGSGTPFVNSTVTFDSTLDGAYNLILNADVVFGGMVGQNVTTPLASLAINGQTTINTSAITTTASQTYNGAVKLGADETTLNGVDITFNDTINSDSLLTPRSLIVNDSGVTKFYNAVGNIIALLSLTTDAIGSTEINGGSVTTTGSQTYNDPVNLGLDTTLTTTDNGSILFNNLLSGAYNLILSAEGFGDITFNGIVNIASLEIDTAQDVNFNQDFTTTSYIRQLAGSGITTIADSLLDAGGDIYIETGGISFQLNARMQANNGLGAVTLIAQTQDITSGAAAREITADNLTFSAAGSVGALGNPLTTNISEIISGDSTTGDIYIDNAGGLIIDSMNAAVGLVDILTRGFTDLHTITASGPVTIETLLNDIYFSGTVTSNASGVNIIADNGSIFVIAGAAPHIIAYGDTFLSVPHGVITVIGSPLDVSINNGAFLTLNIGAKLSLVSGWLTGTVADYDHILFLNASFPTPPYPPGLVYFSGVIIWPTPNALTNSQTNNALLARYTVPFNFSSYQLNTHFNNLTFYYHPLTESDMSAFDSLSISEEAYNFIDGSLNFEGHEGLLPILEKIKKKKQAGQT